MRTLAAALLLAGTATLGGCSSAIDQIPTWAGGLPANAPMRPAAEAAYPAVHDMPPARNDIVLTDEERKRLKDELISVRERTEHNLPAGAATGAASKP